MPEPQEYDAGDYWSARLDRDFSLRGTGHRSYSQHYNYWLYRAKRQALKQALKGVPRNIRALDVGSGVGWVIEQLRSRGHNVDGCDISALVVDRLSQRFPDVEFFTVTLGATELPRPAGAYGLVTALDVAYHITSDEQWRAGLADLGRVLGAGGHLVITDRLGDQVEQPAAHVRFRTHTMWLDAARDAGLELDRSGVLYRWLSRDRPTTRLSRLPDGLHGATAYALDRLTWRTPHLRWARFRRTTQAVSG